MTAQFLSDYDIGCGPAWLVTMKKRTGLNILLEALNTVCIESTTVIRYFKKNAQCETLEQRILCSIAT